MNRRLALVFALVAVAVAAWPVVAGENSVEPLVKITAPSPAWRNLTREELARQAPGAAAGAVNAADNMMGFVIVEAIPAGVADLADYARKASDRLRLDDKRVGEFLPIQWKSRSALRFTVVGASHGVLYRYGYLVLFDDNRAMQVVCHGFAAMTDADGATFHPFFNAVEIQPKPKITPEPEPVVKPKRTLNPDDRGVGWRIGGGVFTSHAYRFSVDSRGEWKITAGQGLEYLNPAAEVAFENESSGVQVVIIAETAKGVAREEFQSRLREGFADGLRTGLDATFASVKVGEIPVTLHRFYRVRESDDPPASADIEYYFGSFFKNDIVYQIIVPFPSRLRAEAAKEAEALFRHWSFLPDEKLKGVAEDNQRISNAQNQVTLEDSLRNGLYRNYAANVTWRKPFGSWRIHVGERAGSVEPDGFLFVEEPTLGIYGLLTLAEGYGSNGELQDLLVQEAMVGAGFETEPIRENTMALGSATARFFWANGSGESPLKYLIGTTVWEDFLVELRFWGLAGNVVAAAPEIREAINGFRFHEQLPETELNEGQYTNHRLGYRFEAPRPKWKFEDLTDEEDRDYASVVSCYSDDQEVMIVAYCPPELPPDDTWFARYVWRKVYDETGLEPPEKLSGAPSVLAGYPAVRYDFSDSTIETSLFTMKKDRTNYALFIYGARGERANFGGAGMLSVNEFRGRFELVR